MTKEQFPVTVTQVHAVALAVAEDVTLGTDTLTHPLAVAVLLIAILPHIPEIIFVDVALVVVCTNARTRRY